MNCNFENSGRRIVCFILVLIVILLGLSLACPPAKAQVSTGSTSASSASKALIKPDIVLPEVSLILADSVIAEAARFWIAKIDANIAVKDTAIVLLQKRIGNLRQEKKELTRRRKLFESALSLEKKTKEATK